MNARSMTFSGIKHYQTSSCSRNYLKGHSPKTHIKTAPNAAEKNAIALQRPERLGTDLMEDCTGTLAGKTGGAYDVNSLAYVGGGYAYRKYSMGSMTLLGINLKGDTKNTIYIKDWQSGQLGISLSGQEDNPEKPQSSPAQVTSLAGNDVDFILNNDAGDGGQGNDFLQGTVGQSVLAGGVGNDILNGTQDQYTTNSIALNEDSIMAKCSKNLRSRTKISFKRCAHRKYKLNQPIARHIEGGIASPSVGRLFWRGES